MAGFGLDESFCGRDGVHIMRIITVNENMSKSIGKNRRFAIYYELQNPLTHYDSRASYTEAQEIFQKSFAFLSEKNILRQIEF